MRHGLSRRRTKGDLETEHVIAVMIAKLGAISLTRNQSRSADDVGRDDWNRLPNNLLHPDEKLRDAVDLIVIRTIWKREELPHECRKPGGVLWQINMNRLDFG